MGVNMYGALSVHESPECEDEEGNVGTLTTLVNVESSNVSGVVDVVRDEKCGLKDVEDIIGSGGCGEGLCVDVVLMNLIKEDLRGVGIVDSMNLVKKDLLASGWEVGVEVNVVVNNAGGGCGCKFGEKGSCKEKIWTARDDSGLVIPWIVRGD